MKLNKDTIRLIISVFGLLFGAFYLSYASFGTVPVDNTRTVDTVIGFISATMMSSIVNFYFGSSQGSSDKQEAMNKQTKEPGTPTT